MQYVNLFNLKLSHIKIFLYAVKNGNFTKAAEELHLTQSMVSKIITNIENETGICLFIRSRGKLQITPAARQLYIEWVNIINYFETSIENAHLIQKGQNSRLRVGNSDLAMSESYILNNIRILEKQNPDISVDLEHYSLSDLTQKLSNGDLDIIFTSKHVLPSIRGLGFEWKQVLETFFCVFIHKSNPLFAQHTVELSSLHSENFIALSFEADPNYIDLLNMISSKCGFTPRIACYVHNPKSFKSNLELGKGVVFADDMCDLACDEIKKISLHDYENGIIAVWNNNSNKYLHKFINLF